MQYTGAEEDLKPPLAKILPCYKVLLLANKKFPSRDLCCILLPRIDLDLPDKKQTWRCRSGTNYYAELLTWLCQEVSFPLLNQTFSSIRAWTDTVYNMFSVACIVKCMLNHLLYSISFYWSPLQSPLFLYPK